MDDKSKVESAINLLHLIWGSLHILLDQSQISSQDRKYYIDKIFRCCDLLDSLECMKDEKEEGD